MGEIKNSSRLKIQTAVDDLTTAILEYHDETTGTLPKADNTSRLGGVSAEDLKGEAEIDITKHTSKTHDAHKLLSADDLNGVSKSDLDVGFLRCVDFYNLPLFYINFTKTVDIPMGRDLYELAEDSNSTRVIGFVIGGDLKLIIHGHTYEISKPVFIYPEGIKDYSDGGFIAAEVGENDELILRLLSDRLGMVDANPENAHRMYIGVYEKNNVNKLWSAPNAYVHGFLGNTIFSLSKIAGHGPDEKKDLMVTRRHPTQRAHI